MPQVLPPFYSDRVRRKGERHHKELGILNQFKQQENAAFFMVHVYLNQETYNPGDELKVAVTPSRSDRIQLLSVRCVGYVRLPVAFARDMHNRSSYAFKDKPIGPVIPDDSILLWVTPNFPVHFDMSLCPGGLVKLYIPYFLPPSLRGGLFEICHYLEVSILNKGEFDMKIKKIPLTISSSQSMPKRLAPAVGDGYEQIDFSLPPAHQWTPHGKRCSGWEAVDLIRRKAQRRTVSGIFKSRRGFRISFNNQHAMEILTHGEWLNERMLIEDATALNVQYRFEDSGVAVKRVTIRVVRVEKIIGSQQNLAHEAIISESTPLTVSQYSVELGHTISIPRLACASFESDLVSVEYRLDFELRAVDAVTQAVLEPVVWQLPIEVVPFDAELYSHTADALPAIPFGSLVPLEKWKDFEETFPDPIAAVSAQESEIEAVKFASLAQPGTMRFTIFS